MKHNALVKKNQTVIKDIEFYNDLECKKKKKKRTSMRHYDYPLCRVQMDQPNSLLYYQKEYWKQTRKHMQHWHPPT